MMTTKISGLEDVRLGALQRHTLAEAQVEMRKRLDDLLRDVQIFKSPGIDIRTSVMHIHTLPHAQQAFPSCGPPQRNMAEEQASGSPAFMSQPLMIPPKTQAYPDPVRAQASFVPAAPTVQVANALPHNASLSEY